MTVLAHYTLRRKDIPLVHFCLEAEQEVTAGMAQTVYQVHVTQVEEERRHLLPVSKSSITVMEREKSSAHASCSRQRMSASSTPMSSSKTKGLT